VVRVKTSVSDASSQNGGAERWLCIHDELLRGLAHAISNRLATIAAAAGVLEVGEVPDARFLEGLRHDADRLEVLLQQLRQLPRRSDAALEPMLFTDALDGAKRLVAEHTLMRGRTVSTVLAGDVLPIRAEPTAVLHATSVALLAAARHGDGVIEAELETVGDEVRLTVRLGPGMPLTADEALQQDAHTIEWLLATSQGRATVSNDGCALALPTLPASRRRAG
jgi:signal transduction histidine kinase